jgi:hypothetical protein
MAMDRIGHIMRNEDETTETQELDWNPKATRRRGRPKETSKRTVLEQAGKCGKHGARLRVWRATGSDGDSSQIPCVPNEKKGCTTITTTICTLNFDLKFDSCGSKIAKNHTNTLVTN